MTVRNILIKAALPIALLSLGACAQSFRADVARFERLPAPQGQTFVIQASDPKLQGGLEFSQYAAQVSDRLAQIGYRPAASPRGATMVVKLNYSVDHGRERVTSSPGYGGFGFSGYGGFGRFGGFGRGYYLGWHDPFYYPGFGDYTDVESYTIYTSELDMQIERTSDGARLFEGTAKAISATDDLPYLVPNLIDAMFTNFPGRSGETVRITLPPPERRR